MAPSVNEPREQRLVAEWLVKEHPNARTLTRVKVGPVRPEAVEAFGTETGIRAMRPWQRWADAVVILQDEVLIIEGKLRGQPGAISQLKLYAQLFPQTPEFAAEKAKRIRKVLLTPWPDEDLQALAAAEGVEVVIFHPPWIEDYVRHIQGYKSPVATARRQAARDIAKEES